MLDIYQVSFKFNDFTGAHLEQQGFHAVTGGNQMGIGGGADSYLPQITYFLDQGWRVFAYDATGSFDSEGKTTKGVELFD